MLVVAILESMWDWQGVTSAAGYRQAPRYFRINPQNKSGRVLYKIVGEHKLLVTESCRELVTGPNQHGKPDPAWLKDNLVNLELLGMDLLLVCGVVASKTFSASGYISKVPVFYMKHPGRAFSNELAYKLSRRIRRIALAKELQSDG